jgi:hypothetical protein
MCSMVCTEMPNQIKFVSRPHPTGSRTDFVYTDFVCLYTMNPSKTARKFVGEWNFRTRIMPLLSSMKPARCQRRKFSKSASVCCQSYCGNFSLYVHHDLWWYVKTVWKQFTRCRWHRRREWIQRHRINFFCSPISHSVRVSEAVWYR